MTSPEVEVIERLMVYDIDDFFSDFGGFLGYLGGFLFFGGGGPEGVGGGNLGLLIIFGVLRPFLGVGMMGLGHVGFFRSFWNFEVIIGRLLSF